MDRPARMSLALAVTLAVTLVVTLPSAGCGPHWKGSVGAILGKSNADGHLFVREVPPDMGAGKAGLRAGDEVTAIDGKAASSMTAEEVHEALEGAVGTKVKIRVLRDGQSLTFDVERGALRP